MANGATQPKRIHKVSNMFRANTIRSAMNVGDALDRVQFNLPTFSIISVVELILLLKSSNSNVQGIFGHLSLTVVNIN